MAYEWILENREILKIVYALFVVFVCSVIVLKTDRLFKISDYQGLRYFRNSFFFFGVAFLIRYLLIPGGGGDFPEKYSLIVNSLFEFFIITGGLLLFYSLIWKKIEKEKHYHSFLNLNMVILYSVALVITIIDSIVLLGGGAGGLMYISQVLLFLGMSIMSYINQKKSSDNKKRGSNFSQLHFFIISVGLIVWILNTALYFFWNWNNLIEIIVYFLNIVFFSLFFYAVIKMTSNKNTI